MNKMYEYLKNHAYISYKKKSNYQFELSEERAKCIANKYDSLTYELQKENKELKNQLHDASIQIQELTEQDMWCPSNCEKLEKLQQQCKKQKEVIDKAIEYIKETKLKEFEKSYGKRYGKTFTQAEVIVCNMILNKMQELQRSDSDE